MNHRRPFSNNPLSAKSRERSGPTSPCVLRTLLLLFALAALPLAGYAQSATATLSGAVEDERGAVVPGATVTVTNNATGTKRDAVTNAEGYFTMPLLQPGAYTVKAQHDGFRVALLDNVILNVGDQKALRIPLQTGDIKETVNITGEAPLINESPAVGTVVDRQFVENLPLNGRSFQSLITLTPGVVLTKASSARQGQFSVNGQRADANYFMVDGVSANIGASGGTLSPTGAGSLPGLTALGGTNNLVSVDALQEFQIQTSTFAAEFGRTPGAQVSIVTRSGTNKFQGALFNYFRNDALDANNWFANRAGFKRPPLRQNDFGGVLGGPVFLPRFGEGGPSLQKLDRTFFFFSYEGLRLRQPQFAITQVPSLAARQAGSPALQPLLNIFPVPNGPELGNGVATFSSGYSDPSTLNATSIRIDSNVRSNLTLFGRYNYAPSETGARGTSGSLNSIQHFKVNTQTLTLGATNLLTSKVSNDLRVNYSRNRSESFYTLDNFGGAIVPSESTLFPTGSSAEDSRITVSAGNAGLQWGRLPSNLERQINVVDGLSAILGAHQLKFGLDYRRLSPVFRPAAYAQTLVFSGVGTPGSPAAGTVLSGRALFVAIVSNRSPMVPIFNNLSAYAQDTWKTTTRLTLTYGLRWELVPPPHEANGNAPLTVTQVSDPASISLAPPGTPLWKTTYNNFAPRIGIAYRLAGKPGRETVLRGGFGLFYDLGTGQASPAFTGSFPFQLLKRVLNAPFPLSASDAAAPTAGPSPSASDTIYVFDPDLKLPRVYQWNASVEQALGANQTLRASYVAAVGRRLLSGESLTSPNANLLGVVRILRNKATSDYHALQIQYQRRLSRGLQALASYTWSHSIDVASDETLVAHDTIANLRQNRGPSDFDVRHAFNGALTYNVPTPSIGKIGSRILSNWSADTMLTARTALPVSVTYTRTTPFGSFAFRPDLVSGVPLYLSDPTVGGGKKINSAAFAIPSTQRQGTLERNALRGFGMWQVDFALRRQFNLGERLKLQFKTEFFNIFNHPNFADPPGGLGTLSASGAFSRNALFGLSASMLANSLGSGGQLGGFNPLYQVGGPRSIQMSLKLNF